MARTTLQRFVLSVALLAAATGLPGCFWTDEAAATEGAPTAGQPAMAYQADATLEPVAFPQAASGAGWAVEDTGQGLGDEAGQVAYRPPVIASPSPSADEGVAGPVQVGEASHYGVGDGLSGRPMANGRPMRPYDLTAAHRTLPLNSYARVERLDASGQPTDSVVVKITDRGPAQWTGRVIDMSYGAARELGFTRAGTAQVRVTPLAPGALAD